VERRLIHDSVLQAWDFMKENWTDVTQGYNAAVWQQGTYMKYLLGRLHFNHRHGVLQEQRDLYSKYMESWKFWVLSKKGEYIVWRPARANKRPLKFKGIEMAFSIHEGQLVNTWNMVNPPVRKTIHDIAEEAYSDTQTLDHVHITLKTRLKRKYTCTMTTSEEVVEGYHERHEGQVLLVRQNMNTGAVQDLSARFSDVGTSAEQRDPPDTVQFTIEGEELKIVSQTEFRNAASTLDWIETLVKEQFDSIQDDFDSIEETELIKQLIREEFASIQDEFQETDTLEMKLSSLEDSIGARMEDDVEWAAEYAGLSVTSDGSTLTMTYSL
jgi:hypothetical protein